MRNLLQNSWTRGVFFFCDISQKVILSKCLSLMLVMMEHAHTHHTHTHWQGTRQTSAAMSTFLVGFITVAFAAAPTQTLAAAPTFSSSTAATAATTTTTFTLEALEQTSMHGCQIEGVDPAYLRSGSSKTDTSAALVLNLLPGGTITGTSFAYQYVTGYSGTTGVNFTFEVAGTVVYRCVECAYLYVYVYVYVCRCVGVGVGMCVCVCVCVRAWWWW